MPERGAMVSTPAFLITIDTEGDNAWSCPRETTTRNAEYLPRFQELCERYGFKPTYLATWEMAHSPAFQRFGRDVIRAGCGEIGMHLHAWNSPPLTPLTGDDLVHLPYLIEYPESQMREKVRVLTDALENVFGTRMTSHRAGRWAFNEVYARILLEFGYLVDCSVTPHVSWRDCKGAPNGEGGTDYRGFPESAYYLDVTDISHFGDSDLLEVPVTIVKPAQSAVRKSAYLLARLLGSERLAARFRQSPGWLRPNGRNRNRMLAVLEAALEEKRDYVEFMLHSSELMPGGSPNLLSHDSIEALCGDIEAVFSAASKYFRGCTLREYYELVQSRRFMTAASYGFSDAYSLA